MRRGRWRRWRSGRWRAFPILLGCLPSQLFRFFSIVAPHDIGPEFDHFSTDNPLGGDGESTFNGAPCRTVRFGVVDVRNAGTNQISEHICIIGSPGPAIPFAPYAAAGRPKNTFCIAARTFLKITRVFAKQARQYRVSEEVACEIVSVGRAKPFAIAFRSLSIFREAVIGLVNAGAGCREKICPRIGRALEEQLEFLPGAQRRGIPVLGRVEGRHHPQNPLVLLLLQLVFRCLLRICVLSGWRLGRGLASRRWTGGRGRAGLLQALEWIIRDINIRSL